MSGTRKRPESEERQFTGDTVSRGTKHSLEVHDRGPKHRHRWVGRCECGWFTIPLRSRKSVVEQYRIHTAARNKATKGGRRGGPKPLTPISQLPEALR